MQDHHRTSPFSAPDPHQEGLKASKDQQQQRHHQCVCTADSSPEQSHLSGSAPVTMNSLTSASSHTSHLKPPGSIGSPGLDGGPPFNRSMSALDLESAALVGERVRAGKGKAATSFDVEGKVHGGMFRSASCKTSSLMEDWMGLDTASSCVSGGMPLSNTCSVDDISSRVRVHRASHSQPQAAVGQPGHSSPHTLGSAHIAPKQYNSKRDGGGRHSGESLNQQPSSTSSSFLVDQRGGGAPSFPLLSVTHQEGGPPPFLLASPHAKSCSRMSSGEIGGGAAGIGGVNVVGRTAPQEMEERHRGGRSRSLNSASMGDAVMQSVPRGAEGVVQEVKGLAEVDEEEQMVQGLLMGAGAGASSCCSSNSSRAQSHDAPHSGGSLLMAVAEEEGEWGGAGVGELRSRPVQTLPAVQAQDSRQLQQQPQEQQQGQQQAGHLQYPTAFASPPAARKFTRSSSSGRSRRNTANGLLCEAMSSGGWGFGSGGAVNSCGSSLSLLEFADERSSQSLGNKSMPQSPCNMLYKVRPRGSEEGFTYSGSMRNSSSSMQAGLCSLAHASSMHWSSSAPNAHQGETTDRASLNGPRKVQLAVSASMPHTLSGCAASPRSPIRPTTSMSTSYSSLLEYAEASSRSQSRKLSSCDFSHGVGNLNSCDEQQL
ncbi:hypothetical protein DUNSADRAFT_478 [Dunaliella salina]|uniref:Uncharacterized protein n=1 Tax=Dunaliella salina TaxID=3046 RepID=A0ABQ7FYX0_DUNSA|nr:hypothetical protein DUNSADRAFT_478 [Dunaliella salina]|eukprot:KAF5827545.1 hypothetical protein DUNSADRAFT_478 [Dunaliella salina]